MPSATDPLQVLDSSSGKVKSFNHYTFLQLRSHITLGFSSSTAVTIALDICVKEYDWNFKELHSSLSNH